MSAVGRTPGNRGTHPESAGGSKGPRRGLQGRPCGVDIVNQQEAFSVLLIGAEAGPRDEGSAQVALASLPVETGLRPSGASPSESLLESPTAAAGQGASDLGALIVATSPQAAPVKGYGNDRIYVQGRWQKAIEFASQVPSQIGKVLELQALDHGVEWLLVAPSAE
jgi:hypothetical protein